MCPCGGPVWSGQGFGGLDTSLRFEPDANRSSICQWPRRLRSSNTHMRSKTTRTGPVQVQADGLGRELDSTGQDRTGGLGKCNRHRSAEGVHHRHLPCVVFVVVFRLQGPSCPSPVDKKTTVSQSASRHTPHSTGLPLPPRKPSTVTDGVAWPRCRGGRGSLVRHSNCWRGLELGPTG